MKNILVTGATGHLGTAVLKALLKKISPDQICVITRNEGKRQELADKGFNAWLGSYDDIGSLQHAMHGVDTVLLISSGDQGDRMQEHKNVVDTARNSGVKHFAYTSRCLHDRSALANKLMAEHFDTEDYIFASGMPYTIFRNTLYMDAIPQFIGGAIALEKGIYLPAGSGKVAFASRNEMGEAMANVLTEKEAANKIYNFTGDHAYSFHDVARALSEVSGKEVNYTDIHENSFTAMMAQKSIPEAVIRKITDFITDI